MSGAVIENLSTRKTLAILGAHGLVVLAFTLVGALFTPNPSSSMDFLMTRCFDRRAGTSKEWFYIRPMSALQKCDVIPDLASHRSVSADVRDIVFVAQMPHARGGLQLRYSPWFQYLVGLLEVEVAYEPGFAVPAAAQLQLEVRMAYRDEADPPADWHLLAETTVTRTLECSIDKDKMVKGYAYNCSTLDLFEMGAVSRPFYLINLRIPVNQTRCQRERGAPNCALGLIADLRLVAIHQNGGFTLIWLALKTFACPVVAYATYWYYRRLDQLRRAPTLNERCIFVLGASIAALDFPIEWISLWSQAPFLLLLSDLRQGLFYTVLFSFWLIFAGEHLIEAGDRNNLMPYARSLSLVAVGSLSLLAYDLVERGLQLWDPFHSVWASAWGAEWARAALRLAAAAAALYLLYLCRQVGRAWAAVRNKRAHLYRLKEHTRLKVQAVILRFKFIFLLTLLCAALTLASYFLKQYGESELHGEDHDESWLVGSTSAFLTGTFGVWNAYVLLLLSMYAPSHKQYSSTQALHDEHDELIDAGADTTPLTTFLKPSTD